MEAAKELSRNFSLNFIKTIKFEETPSPAELIKQQQLVTEKFQQIFLCVKSKMIRLEKYFLVKLKSLGRKINGGEVLLGI
jgi:hypothetical protein